MKPMIFKVNLFFFDYLSCILYMDLSSGVFVFLIVVFSAIVCINIKGLIEC